MEKAVSVTTSGNTQFRILSAISVSHMLNDMMQSLLLAIYPLLKSNFSLSFVQIGLITLTYQITASILQPVIGFYGDRRPTPFLLPVAMGSTLCGLLLLAFAPHFSVVLMAAALIGIGSAVFHPESSRVARMASGGRYGLAQSLFQVGGNMGQAFGPLLAAFIVVPDGQSSVAWFAVAALAAIVILMRVAAWCTAHHGELQAKKRATIHPPLPLVAKLPRRAVLIALSVLGVLMFSKFFYLTSISSYYTFFLMKKFQLPMHTAQIYLFVFLFAVALGTIAGGPIGDRVGRKWVIWVSILGVSPFTLLLPHANLFWTGILSVVIGLVLASAFSAIVVYAQELMPGKVGTVAGLFFGVAFGLGGIGAAALGKLADVSGIETVYQFCAYLPLLGLFTAFLPDIEKKKTR